MKKPFYKRWWFIAFAVLLVLGAIGSMGEESATNKSNEPAQVEAEKTQAETPKETDEEKAARETKEAEEKALAEQKAKEEESIVVEVPVWQTEIENLAGNPDGAADKFYALEKFMMEYKSKTTSEEVDLFKKNILKAYQDKSYLNNPTDHQIMLTQIFQSYIVEQKSDDAWKDFAFDFHQNVKYVYRGVDAPNSDAVKANEEQMNKVIDKLK